jgi:putative Holliday junction resolvase
MAAILGLDVGDKRVGTALVEAGLSFAIPHKTFERAGGAAEREILNMIEERGIELVVVGLPLDREDNPTTQSTKVRQFCRRLEKRSKAKFCFWDEAYSTEDAKQRLSELNQAESRLRKKGVMDKVAAAIMLQSYLDANTLPPG